MDSISRMEAIIDMYENDGLTYQAISDRLGISCTLCQSMHSRWKRFRSRVFDMPDERRAEYIEFITLLDVRVVRALKHYGISSVKTLFATPDDELRKMRGIGDGAISEIRTLREAYPNAPKNKYWRLIKVFTDKK